MDRAVIVGIGETPLARHSDRPDESWLAEAIRLALDDAELTKNEVDGLAVATISLPDDSPHIAEHLGFEVGWLLKADYGGASSLAALARARAAIETEMADVVVIAAGGNRLDKGTLSHDRRTPPHDYSLRNWMSPYGYDEPNGFFGLIQRRHMYEYGTTLEQLGKVAVTFRENARRNDTALLREPMSMDDYLSSRLISDPIRRADCVMRCAGGAALVVTSERVAERLPKHPVHLGGYGERASHQGRSDSPDRLETGLAVVRDRIFANTSREAVDFAQLYDDYPIAVLMMLEDLGFCGKGEGGAFIEKTDISITGELPLNTGGGQLSVGQANLAGGALHIVEAVRQLRGEAHGRQVENARIGLVTGIGMMAYLGNLTMACGMILSKEAFA